MRKAIFIFVAIVLVAAIKTTSAGSSRKSTTGKCSKISAQASAVQTASCSTPHAKVTRKKEQF